MIKSFLIQSDTKEKSLEVERETAKQIGLDRVYTNVIRRFPNGVEHQTEEHYRFGDYFDKIETNRLTDEKFDIVFHVKKNPGRFWRDLIAIVVTEAQECR